MQVDYQFESEAIQASIKKLQELGADMTQITSGVTAVLKSESQKAFIDEKDPTTGKAWQQHSAAYTKHLQSKGIIVSKILQRNADAGGLNGSLSTDFDAVSAAIGTNKIYGAIHQLGGTADMRPANAAIPARPYMGLSKDGIADIIEIINKTLSNAINQSS